MLKPLVVAFLSAILPASVLGGDVYFTKSFYSGGEYVRQIVKGPVAGGKTSVVYHDSVNPLTTGFFYGLDVDPSHKTAYFCDKLNATVKSVDIATGTLKVVAEAVHGAQDLAVDYDAGTLYVAGGDSCTIWSAPLSGGTPQALWTASNCTIYDSITPAGLALDVANRVIYFTDPFKQHIMTLPMKGGKATILDLPGYYGSPQTIRLDLATRTMFMTDQDLGLLTAPMQGGSKPVYVADMGQIYGLALDRKSGNVWFANLYLDYVGFEPMKGGDVKTGTQVYRNVSGGGTPTTYTLALAV